MHVCLLSILIQAAIQKEHQAHAMMHKKGFAHQDCLRCVQHALSSDQYPSAADVQPCRKQCCFAQVVADIDNDLEVGVFLGAYRQLAQRQDLETRRLCAESCVVVLKAATPRRSAGTCLQVHGVSTLHCCCLQ